MVELESSYAERVRDDAVPCYLSPIPCLHDRLNQVLTTAGWNRTFTLSTISNLTRRLWDGSSISTGKVLVSATVTINRLGSHPAMESVGRQRSRRHCGGSPGLQAGMRRFWLGSILTFP